MYPSLLLFFPVAALAVPQQSAPTATAPPISIDAVTTAVPSPSLSLTAQLGPSALVQLPPQQSWCPSSIFCAGSILQTLNLAQFYVDSKTIVDKPTNKSSADVIADFASIVRTANGDLANITVEQIVQFLDVDFRGEGLELIPQNLPSFNPSPPLLNNITDPLVKGFASTVNSFWRDLIRGTNSSTLCQEGNSTSCESSLIPLNHTITVPGGRFREQYYWDSYWIIEGLIKSGLLDIANDTLQNFINEIDTIGFIPNGGRVYYLDRSQPPLFVHMLQNYIVASNDASILTRALPLAEKEMTWWLTNRSLNVTSPFTNITREVYRYRVVNSAPRPESYLSDFLVTNGPDLSTPYTEDEREALWAELATGAESGWDYCSRFIKEPTLNLTDNTPALRTLNIRSTAPVDLNSILYNAHTILSSLYSQSNLSNKSALSSSHARTASSLRASILDLFWDPSKLAFYDFNLTSSTRNTAYTAATFYPLWVGITPDEVLASEQNAQGFFASVGMVLARYNGTFPTTFVTTGLQWDAPNAWAPHQYIIIQALRALPSNISSSALPAPVNGSRFTLVPSGQLGLSEEELPVQTLESGGNFSQSGSAADINIVNGSIVNGGNGSITSGGWRDVLVRGLANRYIASTLCSFQASGGSIPGLLPQLPPDQRIPGAENLTGLMFEKFSNNDVSSAGRGGEYTVQTGFGWTNGVVLWAAGEFGTELTAPICPTLVNTASASNSSSSSSPSSGAVSMTFWNGDAMWMVLGALSAGLVGGLGIL